LPRGGHPHISAKIKRREFIALLGDAVAAMAARGARAAGREHTVRYTELAPDRFKNFWQ
jgi:hypothetical protein